MQLPAKEKKKLIGLLKEDQEQSIQISEEHKNIVRERINKYGNDPDKLVDWDDVQNSINIKERKFGYAKGFFNLSPILMNC